MGKRQQRLPSKPPEHQLSSPPSDSFASPTDEILILMFLDKIKSKSTNEFIRKFVQNKEMESLSDAYGKSFRRLTVSVRVYF